MKSLPNTAPMFAVVKLIDGEPDSAISVGDHGESTRHAASFNQLMEGTEQSAVICPVTITYHLDQTEAVEGRSRFDGKEGMEACQAGFPTCH
jgi:hypothetical protein